MTEIVFVTGSTGATGQEIVRGLVELGVNVLAGFHSEASAPKAKAPPLVVNAMPKPRPSTSNIANTALGSAR